jgi:hypothetical protein
VHRFLLVLLAACGRIGFGAGGGGDATGGDDTAVPDATGSAGPRWAVTLGNNNRFLPIAGENGAPIAAWAFTGSTTVAGEMITGTAVAQSSVVARFDATGAVLATTVLDATTSCDIRGISLRGDTALVAGLTNGSMQAGLGPCSVSTPGRQEPIILGVDPTGAASQVALGTVGGANAQAWNVLALPDASFVTSGIYSMNLQFGAVSLPAAGADPNAWVARLSDTQADPLWTFGFTAGVQTTPGPIALDGSDLCMLGAYSGGGLTALGTPLPYAGAVDALIARLDMTGAPRFVRGFGSPGVESNFNDGSVVAFGGGCVGSIGAAADVTIDGTTLPASDGPAIVVWFDATGALTGGYRLPHLAQLAIVNGHVFAAYTLSATATIDGTQVEPQGLDVVVVELDAQGPSRLLGVVGGSGDQDVIRLAAIGPDAVAISLASSGGFAFGDTAFTNAPNDRVLAVLGI